MLNISTIWKQHFRLKYQINLPHRSCPFLSLSNCSLELWSQPHCAVHVNYSLCELHRCSELEQYNSSLSPLPAMEVCTLMLVWEQGWRTTPNTPFAVILMLEGNYLSLCTLIVAPSPNKEKPSLISEITELPT